MDKQMISGPMRLWHNKETDSPVIALQSPLLLSNVVSHGFFCKSGGISQGLYKGLNCGIGSDDTADHVKKNRQFIQNFFGENAFPLVTPYQTHGSRVHQITNYDDLNTRFSANTAADAIVTNLPHIPVGILTADCAPILFCDFKAKIIAAAHAGWKGAKAGIIQQTIAAMQTLGAETSNIHVSVGPLLAQKSYEVTQEFLEYFLTDTSENKAFFSSGTDPFHWQFDLRAYINTILQSYSLKAIDHRPYDTYAHDDFFYSYRRSTHQKQPDYGRQVSAIMLHKDE